MYSWSESAIYSALFRLRMALVKMVGQEVCCRDSMK